ncbi:MAG: ribulose-phosphate 3-epimerase [Roseburia sp.]|nr:ribulose-phosphate 3-epimerase [Anaeroplasma bactoclasticum]MCM1196698.1 ribulose-phosphate 3-epimerase [Roseburia sp.]MCM1556806.1 ribulose-phosphate 3-epimerase [Anaeroplasma bactoclasticum]
MEISLSILNINYNRIEDELKKYKNEIKILHLDIMDGHFVPNISFGSAVVKSIHKENNFIYDTHLMISDPMKYIKDFVDAGSDYITFHLEAVSNVNEVIDYIHDFGVKAGLAIKPNTKVEEVLPYLSKLDLVLIMSVEPGFGGQKFMESSIEKAIKLKQQKEENKYSYLISIDGGINNETIQRVEPYLDLAVVGSYITASKNPLENIKLLKHNL